MPDIPQGSRTLVIPFKMTTRPSLRTSPRPEPPPPPKQPHPSDDEAEGLT